MLQCHCRRIGAWCWLLLVSVHLYASEVPVLQIEGGSTELNENIRQYLTIADEPCSSPLWRLKSLLADAQSEIENAAQAVGYYQLTYTTNLTQARECWQLHIHLTPGEPVNVSELRVDIRGDGGDDPFFKSLYDKPDIHVGDRLNHGAYENLKNRIATMATSHGYFDGRFDLARILVNAVDNTATIELVYETGARYRIGVIRMTHKILNETFLQRYFNIKSGDFYDTDTLLELKTFFNATNYFALSTASPDLQHLHDHVVDIDVQLEERKRYAYSVGAGVSTDTGPRVLLGFEDRYVNDSGHSIKADLSESRIKTNAQISYTIPLAQPSYEFAKIYTGYDRETTDTLISSKDTLGVSYTYYQHNHWLHTYALELENETSLVADEKIYTHLVIPSVTFSRTQTDGSPYPLAGWSLLTKLSGSPKTFGSDVSFEQFYIRAKYVQGFTYGRLLLRTELGVTDVNDFGQLPASLRYFAGGDNSVRGYDYKSLGPVDSTGTVIGGNNLWVSSAEYDYQFRPSWAVATFIDVGNAADDFQLHFKRGAGVGLRWISPIGPVRIDVARGLDEPQGWHLHISMGPDL